MEITLSKQSIDKIISPKQELNPKKRKFFLFTGVFFAFSPVGGIWMSSAKYYQVEVNMLDFIYATVEQMKAWTNGGAIILTVYGWSNLIHYKKALAGKHGASRSDIVAIVLGVAIIETGVTGFAMLPPFIDYYDMGGDSVGGTFITLNIHLVCPILFFILFQLQVRETIDVKHFAKYVAPKFLVIPALGFAYNIVTGAVALKLDPSMNSGANIVTAYPPFFDIFLISPTHELSNFEHGVYGTLGFGSNVVFVLGTGMLIFGASAYRNNKIYYRNIKYELLNALAKEGKIVKK